MRYLILLLLLCGCTTVSDKVTFGTFSYSHQRVDVAGSDVVSLTQIVTSPGSIWNSPLLKSAATSLLNLIFEGND